MTNYLINSSILYPIEINDDNTITEYTANKVEGIFGGHANSASIFKYPDNTVKLLTRNLGQTTIAVFDVTFPQSIGIISCPGWNYSPNYTADSSWNYNRNLGPLSVIQNPVTTKIYGFQTQTPADLRV